MISTVSSEPLPVICLAGPTGSGKTAIALKLAEDFGCEIINADSRQVYADFPIVTAQPTKTEKALIPHHLYGFLSSNAKISAGRWASMARSKAAEILSVGKIPLIVGGTGLYFRALLHGLSSIPPVAAEISQIYELRMAANGAESMYRELQSIDSAYAARIHPHDKQRIQRALEVYAATGKTFSWWHINSKKVPLCNGPLIILDIKLNNLEPFLKSRIKKMMQAGALDEVQTARALCPDKEAPAWSGIGCSELLAAVEGRIGPDECERLWLASTRAYAKRQITWFKAQKEAVFISPGDIPFMKSLIKESWAANSHT